jgi:hypothetical protein
MCPARWAVWVGAGAAGLEVGSDGGGEGLGEVVDQRAGADEADLREWVVGLVGAWWVSSQVG